MNATTHSALGCSPASILYGTSIDLNQNLYPKIEERLKHNDSQPLSKYLTQAMQMQYRIIELATKNQEQTDFKHLARKEVSSPSNLCDSEIIELELYSKPGVLSVYFFVTFFAKPLPSSFLIFSFCFYADFSSSNYCKKLLPSSFWIVSL